MDSPKYVRYGAHLMVTSQYRSDDGLNNSFFV